MAVRVLVDLVDRRSLKLKEPCKECPFRLKAPANYLGGYRLEPYRQPPSVGLPTTCHMKDYGMTNKETAFCTGSCAVIANDPDVQPMEGYEEVIEKVGKRDDCFPTVADFAEHHKDADKHAVYSE